MIQPWSNGQTEGQITKLKLVKRQMCWTRKARPAPCLPSSPSVGASYNKSESELRLDADLGSRLRPV
jgi:hypothetical protein